MTRNQKRKQRRLRRLTWLLKRGWAPQEVIVFGHKARIGSYPGDFLFTLA